MNLELQSLSEKVIGCGIAVHRDLGPGYLESIYERAMQIELRSAGIAFECQGEFSVNYRGQEVGKHRFDLLV